MSKFYALINEFEVLKERKHIEPSLSDFAQRCIHCLVVKQTENSPFRFSAISTLNSLLEMEAAERISFFEKIAELNLPEYIKIPLKTKSAA